MIGMVVLSSTSSKSGCCLSLVNANSVDITTDGSITTTTTTKMPWRKQPQPHPYMVVATVDGSVMVLDAQTGSSVQIFASGMPLVSPSSHLPSGRRIVPGLDGRLYVTVLPHEQQNDDEMQDGGPPSEKSGRTTGNVLQPLGITVMDVLHNPVKTCDANKPHQEDCGIVTATKSTSLFAIDSASGNLVWHQSPNGETIQHGPPLDQNPVDDGTQPKFTVLLQREDIMVQQISTDSGLSVWNVTLGSFQGLEFGSESSSNKEGRGYGSRDDMFLPGPRQPLDTNSNFLLDSPSLTSKPNHSRPDGDNDDDDDEDNDHLPNVAFGSDGMTLTAVDPVRGTSLWNREFQTVVASVFGLNGKSWKPLTVMEGTSDESDSASTPDAALPEGANAMTLYRPPSMQEIFVQNEGYLEQMDFLYRLAEEQSYSLKHQQEQNRLLSSKFPTIQDDLQSRRHHSMGKLVGWKADGKMTPRPGQLALPGPEDYSTLPHYDIRSEGVFLPWPVILVVLCCAVVVFQKWYERQKRQWYQDFEAHAELTVTATSTDVTHGVLAPERPGGNPMQFLMHKERRISLRQQLSMPGEDEPPPGPPQVHNVSMTWVQPLNGVGSAGPPAAAAATAPIVPTATNELQPLARRAVSAPTAMLPADDKPAQQVQEVGFLMDGIPLIRYCRYDSEFKEMTALGKGGFGTVFQCQNVLDGREYAIKKVVLKSDSSQSQHLFQQRLRRTLREVKSLALLDHPNIVRYYTAWLELDNNSDETGADRAVGASEYYLVSESNAGATTTEAKTLTNRVSSWRRPSMDHLRRMTDFNPLGGWRTEDEMSFGHNIPGVPKSLEDYGFTFDRSDEEVHENNDAGNSEWPNDNNEQTEASNCNALVQYPVSFASQSSRQDLFARHHSMASIPSSVDESESISRSICSNDYSTSARKSKANGKRDETECQNSPSSSIKHLLYIQMQFCSQKTLADFLTNKDARQGPSSSDSVDIPYALSLFLQIAQGVEHVHTQGLIHRDLKPNNCFIDESGVVKVGDFGLSREAGDSQEDSNAGVDLENDVNAMGDITAGVGTRSYASPEQMKGSDYDSSTDVYSLGIILFELCYPMYTGMERYIVMNKLRNQCFPDQWNNSMKPAFPGLHSLLVSMISSNPRDRPTARVVVERIQSILSGLTISSLDKKHQHEGAILLRVEAQPREDVLRHTIELLKESAKPTDVDVLQYGLRGGTNEAVMEFAIRLVGGNSQDTSSMVKILVNRMKEYREILLIRQVSATKYN